MEDLAADVTSNTFVRSIDIGLVPVTRNLTLESIEGMVK